MVFFFNPILPSFRIGYFAWKAGRSSDPLISTIKSNELIDIINPFTGPVDQHIGGSSTGVVDGNTAAQVLQSAASEPAEEQSSNEAAIAAPEHQDSSKVALYISDVILATAIITFKLVVSRTTG